VLQKKRGVKVKEKENCWRGKGEELESRELIRIGSI
jgi:hypothetical protein